MTSANRQYWMSIEQLEAAEGGEPEPTPSQKDAGFSRRSFLRAAGFGVAGGLLAGCSRAPIRKAIPFLIPAEEIIPGRAVYYSSTCGGCNAGCGMMVKNRDGRPIKLEGFRGPGGPLDRSHPVSGGGLCATGQTSLLELYDSKRLDAPRIAGKAAGWDAADAEIARRLSALSSVGSKVVVLTETLTSPTTRARVDGFLSGFASGQHVEYDPQSVSALLDAHEQCFGRRAMPRLHFDRADVILSFDCDFLGSWVSPVEFSAAFVEGREPSGSTREMSWMVQVESRMSPTGAKADRRIVARERESYEILRAVAAGLSTRAGRKMPGRPSAPAGREEDVTTLVDRLWAARGKSLVVSGRNDLSEQILVCFVNDLLGNYDGALDLRRPSLQRRGRDESVTGLIEDMEAGRVGALVIRGVNPVYDRPDGARFAAALSKVETVIAVTGSANETTGHAGFICPDPGPLESWDDAVAVHGVLCLSQPVIAPLFDSRSFRDSLARWSGVEEDDLEFRRKQLAGSWKAATAAGAGGFDEVWNQAVHDGVVELGTESLPTTSFRPSSLEDLAGPPRADGGGLELVLYQSVAMSDGRHAHNAWLQEIPDPIAKTTWGNAAALAPSTARSLGLADGDEVSIVRADVEIRLPVRVQPGQHEDVVAVALGYGREGTDRFAKIGPEWIESKETVEVGGVVGAHAGPLGSLVAGRVADRARVTLTGTGKKPGLATTQVWDSIDVPAHLAPAAGRRRPIVRETTTAALAAHAADGHGSSHHAGADLWKDDHGGSGAHWGMVIDLNRCTGCNACVAACQVENNVPVVGRDEVMRNREMHWIRIDRYYSGDPEDAEDVDVIQQPMMCHHCDNAPCETVCPVLATVHSEEGINQQVYNRCVGTRYCANNCPYKVRRFNWFDYSHEDRLQNMVLNPDIAVRSRGVMEKCSFCFQRIQEAKAEAKRTGRPIADGDIQPACVQTCPTRAISFGNDHDPGSEVSRAQADPLHFDVLGELNVKPSVGYRGLVRNRDEEGDPKHG